MANKGPRRDGEKREYWQAAIELQQQGGLSVRQFCQQEGLSEPSFYAWRRKLASLEERAASEPVEGRGAKFVPVEISGTASSPLVIELTSGTKLNVGEGCSRELLRSALERLGC